MLLKINSIKNLKFFPKFLINPYFVNFGYIPDDYGTEKLFSTSPISSKEMISEMSLEKYFKEVSNQYSLSSCVSNAIADSFEAQKAQKLQLDPSKIEDLSRLFIYWNARNLANPPTTNKDKGCQIRWGFDSIERYGIPLEKNYPYALSKVNKKPGWLVFKKAIQNKIRNYYRINGIGDLKVIQIKQALSSGSPVVFGTKIYEPFRHVNNPDVVKLNTNEKYIGRHCMIIVGISESKHAFRIRNSWGKKWGDNGYCFMDIDYIKNSITRDLWVATL